MTALGRDLFGKPRTAGDNLLFIRIRWMLGLWIAVNVALYWDGSWTSWAGAALMAVFLASQLGLWRMKAGFLKGLRLYTVVFTLDLLFTILALAFTSQATPQLLATLFLTIFITALVQRMSLSLVVSGVSVLIYLVFKMQGPGGGGFTDVRQFLDLPFIVLAGLHASVVVGEAQFRQDIGDALDADNQTLSKKLGSAATELKARVRFINGAFDAVPAAALVVDGDGLLRSFNVRAEELFGVRRMALLDRPLKESGILEPLRQGLRALNGEGSTALWLCNAKGAWFYAGLRCGIARDADGRLANMAVFVQPADPPEDTPTYEAWVRSRNPAPPAPSAAPAPKSEDPWDEAPDRPSAESSAAPARRDASKDGPRSALVKPMADTVEHDHPDHRPKNGA